MQKKIAVIMDIGSSKITVIAGERGINKTFLIKGFSELSYQGFSDGVFFDQAELEKVIKNSIKNIEDNIGSEINILYVGVPGEFTTAIVKEHQISFKKNKRITENELDELFDTAYSLKSKNYSLINRSGIYFTLDNNRRIASPIGETAKVLKGKLSYILCDNNFINSVLPTLKKQSIEKVEFTSTPLAEALYLFEPEIRDRKAFIVDCGYLTTSFSLIEGDAIFYQKGFSFGGGYITAMLSEILQIDSEVAEKLKRKVSLTLSENEISNYNIINGDKEYSFPVKKVNDIVTFALDELCENIDVCLADSKTELPEYMPLSLTGGGITFIRGAKEHISSRLNMLVETVSPTLPHMNKPTDSSGLALLDLAIKEVYKKESFLKRIFK